MAVDLIATDAMFPDYRPGMDTDAYLKENNNYLFLLKESLNYTLHNLGVANFNARQLQTISDIITKPIVMALVGEDGQLTSIQADLDGIKTTVGSVEGNVSTLQQTVKGLSSKVSSVEGKYTSLSQTVDGFETDVTAIKGDYISKSSATQSASGFKFEVMDSNHKNALVTLNSAGLTIKGGGILVKNSFDQEVLKADTDGNLTLTGTVDSSAIYGSSFYTCAKEDVQVTPYMVLGLDEYGFSGLMSRYAGYSHGISISNYENSMSIAFNQYSVTYLTLAVNNDGSGAILQSTATTNLQISGGTVTIDGFNGISMNGAVNIYGSLAVNGTIVA